MRLQRETADGRHFLGDLSGQPLGQPGIKVRARINPVARCRFLPDLVALLGTLETRVLVDAPRGDFNWAVPLADAVERYIGVDVVGNVPSGG